MTSAPGQLYVQTGGGGGGQVNSVVPGANIAVDNTDPANPVVSATSGAGSAVDEGPFPCNGAVAVGDLVQMDEGTSQLELAKADARATMPANGFVVSKPTGTTAVIRTDGTVTGLSDAAGAPLVRGRVYFVSPTVAGKITSTAPSAGGQVIQKVGEASGAASLMVNVDSDITVL